MWLCRHDLSFTGERPSGVLMLAQCAKSRNNHLVGLSTSRTEGCTGNGASLGVSPAPCDTVQTSKQLSLVSGLEDLPPSYAGVSLKENFQENWHRFSTRMQGFRTEVKKSLSEKKSKKNVIKRYPDATCLYLDAHSRATVVGKERGEVEVLYQRKVQNSDSLLSSNNEGVLFESKMNGAEGISERERESNSKGGKGSVRERGEEEVGEFARTPSKVQAGVTKDSEGRDTPKREPSASIDTSNGVEIYDSEASGKDMGRPLGEGLQLPPSEDEGEEGGEQNGEEEEEVRTQPQSAQQMELGEDVYDDQEQVIREQQAYDNQWGMMTSNRPQAATDATATTNANTTATANATATATISASASTVAQKDGSTRGATAEASAKGVPAKEKEEAVNLFENRAMPVVSAIKLHREGLKREKMGTNQGGALDSKVALGGIGGSRLITSIIPFNNLLGDLGKLNEAVKEYAANMRQEIVWSTQKGGALEITNKNCENFVMGLTKCDTSKGSFFVYRGHVIENARGVWRVDLSKWHEITKCVNSGSAIDALVEMFHSQLPIYAIDPIMTRNRNRKPKVVAYAILIAYIDCDYTVREKLYRTAIEYGFEIQKGDYVYAKFGLQAELTWDVERSLNQGDLKEYLNVTIKDFLSDPEGFENVLTKEAKEFARVMSNWTFGPIIQVRKYQTKDRITILCIACHNQAMFIVKPILEFAFGVKMEYIATMKEIKKQKKDQKKSVDKKKEKKAHQKEVGK
jgi:hypothetical protein